MSRVLSELLGADEPKFTLTLRQLEATSGGPDADVRLTSDIARKAYQKQKELGLDPRDTTGEELYHTLQALIKKHDEFLAQAIGVTELTDTDELLVCIVKAVERLAFTKSCWAIKPSVGKRLIRAMPPKKVMKQLGYKSIDSMLKRENIYEIYAALRLAESPTWLDRFISSYRQLQTSDFETRNIKIISLSAKRWGDVPRNYVYHHHRNLTHLKEFGIIVVLPLPGEHLRGICITVLSLLLYYVNEIRLYSTFFKLQQVKPNFADIFVTALRKDTSDTAMLAGQPLHWRAIQRHFGRLRRNALPAIFEPYVQPDDLLWQQAETLLYRLEPALKFWEGMDYVAVPTKGRPISFNLMDNALGYCNQLPYSRRVGQHFRASLWDELWVRYMSQTTLEQEVIKQLDYEAPEPDLVDAFDLKGI